MDSMQRAAKLELSNHPGVLAGRLAVAEIALESLAAGTWPATAVGHTGTSAAHQFAADTLAQMNRFLPARGV